MTNKSNGWRRARAVTTVLAAVSVLGSAGLGVTAWQTIEAGKNHTGSSSGSTSESTSGSTAGTSGTGTSSSSGGTISNSTGGASDATSSGS
jgi:hypothetical protein